MQWALVGGLGEAAAAFFLFGLCVVVITFIKAIAAALDSIPIPVVGSWIAGAFRTIANPVESWLVGASNELWSDMEWWFRGIAWTWSQMMTGIRDVLQVHAGQISHVYSVAIPEQGKAATSQATHYTNDQVTTLNREIAAARSDFTHLANTDEAAEYAKAEKLVGTLHHELTGALAKSVSTAEASAVKRITSLHTQLETEIAALRRQVGAIPVTGTGEATAPIAAPVSVPGADIAGQVAVLGGTVAAVQVAVRALTSEFESCAVTSCAGPNNLSSLLNALLGGIALADVAVFLDKAINDPAGAIGEYEGEIVGAYDTIKGGGTDVWSAIESVLSI